MEVYTERTCLADVKTCASRSEVASDGGTLLHLINAPAKATSVDHDTEHADRKALQQLPSQSKKKPSNAVHVVVVINETENPHILDMSGPKLNHAECRICHEEEELAQLDKPCACTGTLMYAHPKCVQRWCDEKGDTTCEICKQPYKDGYTASPQSHLDIATFIDVSDQVEVRADEEGEESSNLVVVAAAQRRFLDAEYEESNSSSAACCRSAALLFMVLLLLRHAIAIVTTSSTLQEDTSMLFSLFLLRVAGFLLPCYIMVRAMSMFQRRHRQEEANMQNMHATSTEVAIIFQAGRLY